MKKATGFNKSAKDTGAGVRSFQAGGRQGAFYDEHKNRTFYVRRDLNDVLVAQQQQQGRGTTHRIVNEALEMYMKAKGWINEKKEGGGDAEGERESR